MAANLVEISTPMPDDSAKSRASAALERVRQLVITDASTYTMAAADLAGVKAYFKEVDGDREKLKAPSLEGCRRVDAFFKAPLDFLRDAEKIIKGKLQAWDDEQERLRKAEQARLDEIARQERLRKEAEAREAERVAREKAETARREAETQRRAEEKARQEAIDAERARLKAEREAADAKARGDREAEAAAQQQAQAERDRGATAQREAQSAAKSAQRFDSKADTAEQRGAQRAEELHAQAASVVAPIVQIETPKVAGLTSRDNWKAECTDVMALVKAVAEGKAPVAYVMANEQVLGKMAKALKEQFVVPGVRCWPDKIKASGAR